MVIIDSLDAESVDTEKQRKKAGVKEFGGSCTQYPAGEKVASYGTCLFSGSPRRGPIGGSAAARSTGNGAVPC